MSNRKDFLWIALDGEGTLAEQLDRVLHNNQWSNLMNSLSTAGTYTNVSIPFVNSVRVVDAARLSPTTARITYRFPVLREYLNPGQTLHGGQQAAFYDIGTSWLLYLVRRKGFWTSAGTSRSLTVTYLRPAVEGEVVVMECEIVNLGKRLCLLKGSMKRERDGALVSTCEHTKFNVDADREKI